MHAFPKRAELLKHVLREVAVAKATNLARLLARLHAKKSTQHHPSVNWGTALQIHTPILSVWQDGN